jgi:hypothetical protein
MIISTIGLVKYCYYTVCLWQMYGYSKKIIAVVSVIPSILKPVRKFL